MYESYKKYYVALQDKGKYRKLPATDAAQADFIDFSTNDYLGLSGSSDLLAAAQAAGAKYGVGATGARLLSGNIPIFQELENQIAIDKKTEAALIFNSGFQANLTVLASLLDPGVLGARPLVFFDKLNHASLYQAVFLSGAELVRYSHLDLADLEQELQKYQDDPRPKFIVSETIFGMDGDTVNLAMILQLAKDHQAFLFLDEAHATGVIGTSGYGLSTTCDLSPIPHVVMGTFSKALGCCGAYIACSQELKNYFINKCAGFIYSTALSPMVIGAAKLAWDKVRDLDQQRKQLASLSAELRTQLHDLDLDAGRSTTHIVPIILGKEDRVMQAKETLLQQKIIVSAVRPPTVPSGKSRLRIALTVNHTQSDINQLITALKTL